MKVSLTVLYFFSYLLSSCWFFIKLSSKGHRTIESFCRYIHLTRSQYLLLLPCIMMLSIKLLNSFLTLPPNVEHWCFIFHSNTSTGEQLMMSVHWHHFWNIFCYEESWGYNYKSAYTCLFLIWYRNRIGLLINAFW